MTQYGINLGGINYYTSERPFADCFAFSGPPTGGAFDAITALPKGDTAPVIRMIPIDPGSHDYVLSYEGEIKAVQFAGYSTGLKPSGGRATFTTVDKGPDAVADVQAKIIATTPLTRLSMVRADHEASFAAGDKWNPDFIASIKPFPILRPLDWNCTNAAAFPSTRPKPSDPFFTSANGGMPAEHSAELAARLGAKLWYPINHLMPDAMVLETLQALDAKAGPCTIDLEWSNEFGWNYQAKWAAAQATARYGTPDFLRYYGYRSGCLANMAASVSKRFKVNLCSQISLTPDRHFSSFLQGWDEAKAPRDLIAGYAIAGYLNGNSTDPVTKTKRIDQLVALQKANDVEGFYALFETLAAAMVPYYAATVEKVCKPNGIPFKIYETNQSIYSQSPNIRDDAERAAFIAWAGPLATSARMADIEMANIKAAADAGAAEICFFQHCGRPSQNGMWGARPHVSLPPYPIYDRLVAANAPATPTDSLSLIAADLAAVAARLNAYMEKTQ